MSTPKSKLLLAAGAVVLGMAGLQSCKPRTAQSAATGDAAKSFVAPGKYDEFYNIVSGGFNGQIGVYGIPSGRLFRIIPVFSQSPESGYGFSEETKPMLNTSTGFVPWVINITLPFPKPMELWTEDGCLLTKTTHHA